MIEDKLWRPKQQQVEKIHQWRQRRSRVRELVQWDTSEHAWLEDRGPKIYLIHMIAKQSPTSRPETMIDDATSRLHARFVEREVWASDQLLYRQGEPVSNGTEDSTEQQSSAPRRARPAATHTDRPGAAGTRHRLDCGSLTPSQGACGTQLSDGTGPAGEGAARGRSQDAGGSQCLSRSGVYSVVKCDAGSGTGQRRRGSPASGPRTLAGCVVELCRHPAGRQRLHDSVRQQELSDRSRRDPFGPARRARASGSSTGRFPGCAFQSRLPACLGMRTAPQNDAAHGENFGSHSGAFSNAGKKPVDEKLPPDQPGKDGSDRSPGSSSAPRLTTYAVGRAKAARPAPRLLYFKPPLNSFTKVSEPSKAKRSDCTTQGPVDRGLTAIYFGAASVASTLNLPQDRDVLKNHPQSKPHSTNTTSESLSTQSRNGLLTGKSLGVETTTRRAAHESN